MKKILISVLLCIAASALGNAQQVDPSWQISWGTPIVSTTVPATPGTALGPLSQFYNGVPQADQFTGGDMCLKLQAAISYAVTNHLGFVDASHFQGTQACSINPFSTSSSGTTPLTGDLNLYILFGDTLIQTSTPWTLNASGLSLQGQGPAHTQIEYVNTPTQTSVMSVNNVEFVYMDGFFIFGGPTTVASGSPAGVVANGLFINLAHRSQFSHISVWGATTGIATTGAVTDTWLKDHVSNVDATFMNLPNFGVSGYQYTVPTTGFFFSSSGGVQTTNGTVTDIASVGNTTWGVQIVSAQNMVFSGGTTEFNGAPGCATGTCGGVLVQSAGKYTTWMGIDSESNGVFAAGIFQNGYIGSDVWDEGQQNVWINPIAGSTCSGGCNTFDAGGSALGQSWLIGPVALISSGGAPTPGHFQILGAGSVGVNVSGPITASGAFNAASSVTVGATEAPYFIGSSSSATFTQGTGITSVTCADPAASGTSCNSTRGTIKIINSSATTSQVLATITFGTTLPAKGVCSVTQIQGAAWYGLYIVTDNTTGLNIENANSVSGSGTFYVTYQCGL
jgi:hypothetical protein